MVLLLYFRLHTPSHFAPRISYLFVQEVFVRFETKNTLLKLMLIFSLISFPFLPFVAARTLYIVFKAKEGKSPAFIVLIIIIDPYPLWGVFKIRV